MSDPLLDRSRLTRLQHIAGAAFVVELIDVFAAESTARRAALEAALARRDLTALAAAAHVLVAGAGQLGAVALAEEARSTEEAARRGESTAAFDRTPVLIAAYDTALAALAAARGTL